MIKIHFSIKRKTGEDKEIVGKVSSIGLHFIEQPNVQKGIVRLTPLNKDKFNRMKNHQLVITPDGLGFIKDHSVKRDEEDSILVTKGTNVRLRGLNKTKTFFNVNHIKVVDIIDNTGNNRYPVVEQDYPLLIVDDAPVEFYVGKNGRASLSLSAREQYAPLKIFSKKVNGIKILNELIQKGKWTLTKK